MTELLAPAGGMESLLGAIGAGADAVYCAGEAFGARAYAQNFSKEELLTAIDLAHIHGRKLYLAVNTLVKNRELEERLYTELLPLYERGLDGVIVQDLGVFSWIKRQFPGLPLHASTQMTVTGPAGMRFLEEIGAARVVAARELGLSELKEMREGSSLELEAFVHGALCYCYSGQCLFSSLLGGRSGNRGRCAQPCRLPYQYRDGKGRLQGKKELCPLSPKDMCAIELLPEILKAGVSSLKIEGRMKQPGYAAGVTAIYRKYLDLYQQDPAGYRVDDRDKAALLSLFHRGGFSRGYYEQKNGPEMMAFSNEKKIAAVYPEIRKMKEKVKGNLILFPGEPAILELSAGGQAVKIAGDRVQKAENQPMSRERFRQQLEKTGNTPFVFEELTISMEEGIFLPVKALNQLRREAFLALSQALCRPYFRRPQKALPMERNRTEKRKGPLVLTASCETKEQLEAVLRVFEISRIYLPLSLAKACLQRNRLPGRQIFLSLPHVVRADTLKGWEAPVKRLLSLGLSGFLVRNLEGFAWLKERGWEGKCLLDSSLYTWNQEAQAFWEAQGVLGDTAPLELNEKELGHRNNENSEMVVYGRLPLMVSAQCLQKNMSACQKNFGTVSLKDRYQKEFPVRCFCDSCYNVIYNSVPLGLLSEAERVAALGVASVRLSFTVESEKETFRVLRAFAGGYLHGETGGEMDCTKGHFKRGVE